MGSNPPPPPKTPDYGQANSEGVFANAALLPAQTQIQQLSQLGRAATIKLPTISNGQITGYQNLPVDFTGMGQGALQSAQQAEQLGLANTAAQGLINIQNQYGDQFVQKQREEQQLSDPEAFALRQQLGQSLETDLSKGSNLTDSENRNVQEAIRTGQAARGNLYSAGSIANEAMAKFDVGQQLQQQRKQNAQAFVFGQPLASYNVSSAQSGAAPYSPIGGNYATPQMNPNAGQNAANFAANVFGTQANIYNTQSQQKDPLETLGLGILGQGAGMGMSAMMFSSEKVKENITHYEDDGYEVVKNLKVKRYDYKRGWGKKDNIGLIAEETPKPIMVEGAVNMVDLYALMCVMVKGMQTIQSKLEKLEDVVYA